MRKTNLLRLLAMLMAVVMAMGTAVIGASATETDVGPKGVEWEELDPSDIGVTLFGQSGAIDERESSNNTLKDTDMVRVLIVMSDEPMTISEISRANSDELVSEYRQTMPLGQAVTAARISREALDGEKMNVVWSFSQITNAISANVQYGKLGDIAGTRGVKRVIMERRYEKLDEANNLTSQQMTGADGVKSGETGYFGAGTSVAVIDTGLTVDHISFDPDALEYALAENAEKAGMDYDAYVASLGLMTEATIAEHLNELHVHERNPELTAADLYRNVKVPFAFNYSDGTTNVNHPSGDGNEHGSHVAGIAAANRYLPASKVYDMDGDEDFDVDDAQEVLDLAVKGEPVDNPAYTDLNNDGEVTAYDAYLLLLKVRAGDVEEYVSAAQSVRVDGVAPDAQILAMSVFDSTGGSTYSSDYIAALEDAITLGADVSNLSLGSPQPGFSGSHGEFDRFAEPDADGNVKLIDEWIDGVFDKAVAAGMVVSISAGNDGNWADEDDAYQLLYADEGGIGNLGAPGSFEEAFTVASADNTGATTMNSTVANGDLPLSTEDFGGAPTSWGDLDKEGVGSEYEYVFLGDPTNALKGLEQTDESVYAGSSSDFNSANFKGKIAVVLRGNGVSFIDKHQNAAAAGAVAVIVANNVPGVISGGVAGDDETPGTTATIPIVGITMEDGLKLLLASKKNADRAFGGTLKVMNRALVVDASGDPEMSSFSSWGTTGGLQIKPEITTPGGAIMSVNGSDGNTTAYELMSGTSMASPHNAGLAALGVDYVTANNNEVLSKAQKLVPGITAGALVQSLLMSTAVPMVEHDGIEYSVRNQGAGLANIANAVSAGSFITVSGAEGGKVKAELGADENGQFSFTFTVNNLKAEDVTYTLSGSILGQGTTTEDGHILATDEMVKLTGATVTYQGATDGKITVPANGQATVTVTIKAPDRASEGFTNGYYVEGFIYVEGDDVTHSIPLLGWYGDWLDPSMYDVNSITDLYYGNGTRPSHINSVSKNELTYAPIGASEGNEYSGNIYNVNPTTKYKDNKYIEDRNSFATVDPKWEFYAVFPTLMRAASDYDLFITGVTPDGKADPTNVLYRDEIYVNFDRALFPSFYYLGAGGWYDVTDDYGIGIDWDMTKAGLQEGDKVMISFVAVPEYGTEAPDYAEEESTGKRSTDLIEYINNPGSTLHWTFTVDNTAPEAVDQGENTFTLTEDNKLTFKVQDNRYVAAVVILDGSASEVIEYIYPNMETAGEEKEITYDLTTYRQQFGNKVTVAVCDYAANETYYAVNLMGEGKPYGEFVAARYDGLGTSNWISFDKDVAGNETTIFASDGVNITAAEYVNGMVFAQAEDGKLYGFRYEDMLGNTVSLEKAYITTLPNVYSDMAYNYADGRLYGMYSFSDEYGNETHIDAIYLEQAEDEWGDTIEAYSVDEDVVLRFDMTGYTLAIDDNGDMYVLGMTEDEDGVLSSTAHLWRFEVNAEYGSYIGADMGDTKLTLDYIQSATWNHNNEKMYWARFIPETLIDLVAELYEFDISGDTFTAKKVGDLSGEAVGLFVPLSETAAAKAEHSNVPAFGEAAVGRPVFSRSSINMTPGNETELDWYFVPWYAADKEVTFSVENLDADADPVVSVDDSGVVTALRSGKATVTITAVADESLYDTCEVTVSAISAKISGFVEDRTVNIQSGTARLYTIEITNGVPKVTYGNMFTATGDLANFGLQLGGAARKDDTIWASEYGNTGMLYAINAETGEATAVYEPIDGDMIFGMAYSKDTDMFAGIENFDIFADLKFPISDKDREDMLASEDEETKELMWHRLNMIPWLNESQGNLVTREDASLTSIVFTGITSMPGQTVSVSGYGGVFGNVYGNYTADTTWVLMDNVGRLWYIDELTGVTKSFDEGYESYVLKNPDDVLQDMGADMGRQSDLIELDLGDGTYSLFVVRELVETPLYDMFLDGELGITYNFCDICYAGQIGITDEGAGDGVMSSPMFFISIYQWYDEATSNDMYLYVQDRTNQGYDSSIGDIKYTHGSLYYLGDTGLNYINASITSAEYIGGIDETNIAVSYDPGTLTGTNGMQKTVGYCSEDYGVILPTDPGEISMFLGWNVPENMALDYWTFEGDTEPIYNVWDIELVPGLAFEAHWTTLHALTLDPGDLEGAESVTVYPDAYYSLPESLYQFREFGWEIPEDKVFDHWQDENGDTVEYLLTPLEEDTVLTAVWRELAYATVTFKPGNEELEALGCATVEQEQEVGGYTYYDLPNEYSFEWDLNWEVPSYFTFTGWQDADGKLVDEDFVLTEDGAVLTATWDRHDPSSDATIASITYRYYDDTGIHTVTAVPGEGDNWTMTLGSGVDMPTIYQLTVETTDENAVCDRYNGDISIEGDGVYKITVHAEDGVTIKTYTLTITVE